MKLPKMKDCRVDYKHVNGQLYSVLVDYVNNNTLMIEVSNHTIKNLYHLFKYRSEHEMPIDNWPYTFLDYPFIKIDGLKYDY